MRTLLLVGLALVLIAGAAAPAGAGTCKRGKVIYRMTVTSLEAGQPVDNLDGIVEQVFEVRTGGAWARSDDGTVTASGCLSATDLRHFKNSVKRARLKINNMAGHGACIAAPSRRVLVELPQRKKRKAIEQPCGPALDEHTERLGMCLWAAMDLEQSAEYVSQVCKGEL